MFESKQVALYIEGFFAVNQVNTEGETGMHDGPSRIGFVLNTPAYDNWDLGFNVEWGIQAVSPNRELQIKGDQQAAAGERQDPLFTRQGHAFAKHEKWGDFRAGKQWSVYYDVTHITDWYRASGGLASGTFALGGDGGVTGTGRADGAFTWRKKFKELGTGGKGELQLGLQYMAHTADITVEVEGLEGPDTLLVCPPRDCEFGIGHGISLGYKLDRGRGFYIGTAYTRIKMDIHTNRGEVYDISNPADPILIRADRRISASSNNFAFSVGASYGGLPFQEGFYGALVLQRSHNNELAPEGSTEGGVTNFFNAEGSESYLSYTWGALDCYTLYTGHNLLKSRDPLFESALVIGDRYRLEKYFLGFNYQWNERVNLYLESALDRSNEVAQQSGFIAAGIQVDL